MNPNAIFNLSSPKEFEAMALRVFRFQYACNPVYRNFCDALRRTPGTVKHLTHIPFLPIGFFKTHTISSVSQPAEVIFTSSGTTGSALSTHRVTDVSLYQQSFRRAFHYFYGPIERYVILALLPAYLERKGSSLLYMVNDLIQQSHHPESGFYLYNLDELATKLRALDAQGKPTILLGVSFALLDLIEKHRFSLKHSLIMETGGMKGRRPELTRTELHQRLCEGFGVAHIHSEYGMTELLSQAYSKGEGIFRCPPWMRVCTREPDDPLQLQQVGRTGGINIIDLANLNSCAFIATEDLGKHYEDGSFEVLGRYDHAAVRGCNLLV